MDQPQSKVKASTPYSIATLHRSPPLLSIPRLLSTTLFFLVIACTAFVSTEKRRDI